MPFPWAFRTTAVRLLSTLVTVQALISAASESRALDEECMDDSAAFLQRQAQLESMKNSFMKEVDDVDQEQAVKVFKLISRIAKNTSIPRNERSMVMLQEAGKALGHDLNPVADYWTWWKTEPKNYRSQSISPQMWVRNLFGPGRKSQPASCVMVKALLLPIGIVESIMGIAAALSCEESEETALVCAAEPVNAAKSILYTAAYTQYAATWCAPTHKVEYLCGAAASETLSRMSALIQSTMKMSGMCTDDYTYVVEGGEKKFQCAFNSVRVAGYFVVSINHLVKYLTRSKSDYNLEHPVTSTIFDLFSALTWVSHLLVLVVRDCTDKVIPKADCGTKAGETLSYILAYGAAESRRRDYCLDKLNKRGARHNAPPGTHPLNGLDKDGTPKEPELPDWFTSLNDEEDDDDNDEDEDLPLAKKRSTASVSDVSDLSFTDDSSVSSGSFPMNDNYEYDPSHTLIINRHDRAGSALGYRDMPEFNSMWDDEDISDEELNSQMTEDLSPPSSPSEPELSVASVPSEPELQGFKVYNNPTFESSPYDNVAPIPRPFKLPPIKPLSSAVLGGGNSGPPMRQTLSNRQTDDLLSAFLPGNPTE